MIFILKSQDDEKAILKSIDTFLSERGMNISQKKTKVTATQTGFDFLGWHFRVLRNGKFLSMPSKDNYRDVKKKIKAVVNNSTYGTETKSNLLAPIVRGWRNYHKNCEMRKHDLWHISHRTWKTFIKLPSIHRSKANDLIKKAFPSVRYSANKFINVKGNKSPFDGDLVYWSKRNSKYYNGPTVKTLKRNNYRCYLCNHYLYNEEKIELHHVDGNHNNWRPKNLQVLHQSCHDIVHHPIG
jgi:5-methylcytosine-specific restriction endonuclease McrA